MNALQQMDMEKIWKAEIPTMSTKTIKGHKKEYKRIQVIRNMVLGSIKCESVSLFTIICSDVKL
jgi:hypothetical protein